MTDPIQQLLPLPHPIETGVESDTQPPAKPPGNCTVATPTGPSDPGFKPGKVIFRWWYIHPKTGRRIHSKNGRPFPIRINGSEPH